MDDRLVPVVGVVAFFLLAIGVVAFARYLRKETKGMSPEEQRAIERERQQEEYIEESILQGILARDPLTGEVFPTCVCGERAVAYAPKSSSSFMDRLPLLNRLHSLPPRYVIVDDVTRGKRLCHTHRQVAIKKLEEFHAALRAERAQFNSTQEDKVAQMAGAGLERIIKDHHRRVKIVLSATETPMPALPVHKEPIELSPVTIVSSSATLNSRDEEDVA